jgi:hypothetical protein
MVPAAVAAISATITRTANFSEMRIAKIRLARRLMKGRSLKSSSPAGLLWRSPAARS